MTHCANRCRPPARACAVPGPNAPALGRAFARLRLAAGRGSAIVAAGSRGAPGELSRRRTGRLRRAGGRRPAARQRLAATGAAGACAGGAAGARPASAGGAGPVRDCRAAAPAAQPAPRRDGCARQRRRCRRGPGAGRCGRGRRARAGRRRGGAGGGGGAGGPSSGSGVFSGGGGDALGGFGCADHDPVTRRILHQVRGVPGRDHAEVAGRLGQGGRGLRLEHVDVPALPSVAAAPDWSPGRGPAGRSARRRRSTATA